MKSQQRDALTRLNAKDEPATGDYQSGQRTRNAAKILRKKDVKMKSLNIQLKEKKETVKNKSLSPMIEVRVWPIDRLSPYARNPRKNDHAVDRMCASIREFGFKVPCLVRSDGEVVDGHLRLKAALKLGISEIPVILCDEWTPAQVKAFRLMVNRSVGWAEWDEELLALEIEEIRNLNFDLELTGFEAPEIEQFLAQSYPDQEETVFPPPEVAIARPEDLWLLGEHRVLCGDATSPEAVNRLLGERQPRLLVIDPPYGIELDSEWRDRAGLNSCGSAEPSYLKRPMDTAIRLYPRTPGRTGVRRSRWSPASRLGMYGTRQSSRAKCWTVYSRSALCITSRSSGTRVGRSSRAPYTGLPTSPVGSSGKERSVVRQGRRELDDMGLAFA